MKIDDRTFHGKLMQAGTLFEKISGNDETVDESTIGQLGRPRAKMNLR